MQILISKIMVENVINCIILGFALNMKAIYDLFSYKMSDVTYIITSKSIFNSERLEMIANDKELMEKSTENSIKFLSCRVLKSRLKPSSSTSY